MLQVKTTSSNTAKKWRNKIKNIFVRLIFNNNTSKYTKNNKYDLKYFYNKLINSMCVASGNLQM